ncbi:AAA family ATPase [Patescibacteria group bacterium]|jgi:chromosome segregation protein|nr:AAA family ATPase [Patescibacteria group bacterium]
MYLRDLTITGFKSFAKKSEFHFGEPITAIVGPNGSGKSNVAEAFRFVLGEQSIKSLRGKKGEDLIFSGEGSHLNRAAVAVTFDNRAGESGRLLDIDFDEVTVERAVYRDGTNEYQINGSKVRLKDVTELLAGANIGSSGHHIISQGEADRVLSAAPRERRAMIEDALGLRVYQYKLAESERKLTRTRENRAQVENLRKENQPHLKFLERQVAKINKSIALREELTAVYQEYLHREDRYLTAEREEVAALSEEPTRELKEVSDRISTLRSELEAAKEADEKREEALAIERELSEVRRELSRLTREVGSVEGEIRFEERRIEEEQRKHESIEERPIPFGEVTALADELREEVARARASGETAHLTDALQKIEQRLATFIEEHTSHPPEAAVDESVLAQLRDKLSALQRDLTEREAEEAQCAERLASVQEEMAREKDQNREQERELFSLMQRHNDLRVHLADLTARGERLKRDEEEFKRECTEAGTLLGRAVLSFKEYVVPGEDGGAIPLEDLLAEDRAKQEERRRSLERMKIRLEELGGANAAEIQSEYDEVRERDEFLARELEDLAATESSLEGIIEELQQELEERFSEGIEQISNAFGEFFTLMFGGGKASLTVVREAKKKRRDTDLPDEEESTEDEEDASPQGELGVDIAVALPNKRVKGLMMLSGGERALTSIALIFAMSQVNPPPFLILDETDAALDEANSRRYGDMIQSLAERSQLIVITHNRETMSRAGILYGVTMSADGVSKLLSVKFEEGAQFAK